MASLLDVFNASVETKPKVDLLVSDFRPLCTDITVARLATYLDLDIEKGPWLAGGAVRKFYLGQNIENSDLDIWFANLAQFEQAKEKIIALGASEAFASDNAVSYKFYEGYDCYNIQLIKRRFFEVPESIISEFDFTVCQLVTDGRKLITGDNTIQDLKTRTLRLVQARLPEYIIPRVVKYIVYGYRPCLDLLEDIDNNISTINWLKQQNDYEAV